MTPEAFRAQLHAATLVSTFSGDYDLNPASQMLRDEPLRAAAVLVPVMMHEAGLSVLFTLRAPSLSSHAGQVSFPGGKIDASDASAEAAAVREAWEEVGIPPERVSIVRQLPGYITGSGFHIQPVVGLVQPGFEFVPQLSEVADIFELPLHAVLAPENHIVESRDWRGETVHYYSISVGTRRVWGATAGMLVSLSRTLGLRA